MFIRESKGLRRLYCRGKTPKRLEKLFPRVVAAVAANGYVEVVDVSDNASVNCGWNELRDLTADAKNLKVLVFDGMKPDDHIPLLEFMIKANALEMAVKVSFPIEDLRYLMDLNLLRPDRFEQLLDLYRLKSDGSYRRKPFKVFHHDNEKYLPFHCTEEWAMIRDRVIPVEKLKPAVIQAKPDAKKKKSPPRKKKPSRVEKVVEKPVEKVPEKRIVERKRPNQVEQTESAEQVVTPRRRVVKKVVRKVVAKKSPEHVTEGVAAEPVKAQEGTQQSPPPPLPVKKRIVKRVVRKVVRTGSASPARENVNDVREA
jgi:hypothetical protein